MQRSELQTKQMKKEVSWNKRYFNKRFREQLRPYLSNSTKHLDFGCGFGFFGFLLSKDYPKMKVLGIDSDRKSITLGKRKYKRNNSELRCSDKIIGDFDSISMFLVIHHLEKDFQKYLREFYNHLIVGGKIIIFDFRKVARSKFRKHYDEKYKAGEWTDSFEDSYKTHNEWSIKKCSELMERTGFRTLKAEASDDFWFFYVGEKIPH